MNEENLQQFCNFVKELLENNNSSLEINSGRKYVKLISNYAGSRSAWCFIDKTSGEIFKVASWNAPAKHSRGNIAEKGSYENYPWTGPHYLRG